MGASFFVILWSSSGSSSFLCCFPSNQQRNRRTAVAILFLVLLASKSVFNANFFLSINNYTGSYCILLSVFSLAFSAKWDICHRLWLSFRFLVLVSLSLSKKSNFSSKFNSTHSCSISANVFFQKGPLDISILFGIYCFLFCHQTYKENSKWPTLKWPTGRVSTQCLLKSCDSIWNTFSFIRWLANQLARFIHFMRFYSEFYGILHFIRTSKLWLSLELFLIFFVHLFS